MAPDRRACMKAGAYLSISFAIILLVAVDAFGAISQERAAGSIWGIVRFQPSEIAKIAVLPLMVARFINRDVCPPSLKNTAIATVLIFMPTLLVAAQPDTGRLFTVAFPVSLRVLFLHLVQAGEVGCAIVLIAAFIPVWFS